MMDLQDSWYEEKQSAYLYAIMAANEHNILHKKLFSDLQLAAEKQAKSWENKMLAEGIHIPTYKPTWRARFIGALVKLVGSENLHSILSAMKIRGMSAFKLYHNEHKHTSFNAISNLRAAVFGINDGLVSNMSLILGMAGGQANHHTIVLAGMAGLLAGAFSMGAGEYISVRSQREVFEYQIAIEEKELEEYPEEEMEELSLIYQARGVPRVQAEQLSKLMIDNPETGLNTLVREELGLNPEDLVSPVGAMISSFLSFCIGAAVPLLPFLWANQNNLFISIGITALTLFGIGMILSLFSNRHPFLSGCRMLLVGAIAGSVTYLIGHVLGISLY